MRKLLIAIGVIVVLVIIVLLVAPAFIDVNKYHGTIQAQLEKKLNRPVQLGQMSLHLLPFSFTVADVSIAEDPSFRTGRPFATAKQLSVDLKLFPLLFHQEADIRALDLEQPQIELVRNQAGEWNFSTLQSGPQAPQPAPSQQPRGKAAAPQAKPAPAPQQQPEKKAEGEQLSLAKLQITDGQVAITDQQKHQSRAVYDHIDLTLSDYAPGKPFGLDLDAHLPGQGAQLISISGKAGPLASGNMITTPLDADIKVNQVSLSALQKFLNSPALANTDATASGKASVKNSGGNMSSSGELSFENVRINGVELGYPITADYKVADNLANDQIDIDHADLKLGPTPVSISGRVNSAATPMQLDTKLSTSNASISEIAKLAGAFGVAFNPGTNVTGKVDANLTAKGAANEPAMNGTLKMRDLQVSGSDLPQPVKIPAIELALTPQAIHSNDFTASSNSTNLAMSFTLTNYTTPASNINATIKTGNANLGDVLSIAKAYGVSAAEGVTGNGTLSLDARVEGPTKHPESLTFYGSGALQNATLNMPQLTKPLQIRNVNLRFDKNSAILENINASLGSTNASGQLTARNFAAPQLTFSLTADKINVTELQQMVKSTPAAPAKRASLSLIPSAYAAAAPASSGLNNITGNGTLHANQILYNDLLLNNANATTNLDHGLIRMNPVTAELFGGQTSGSILVDTRPAQTLYTVNTKLSNVDSNKLLSATTSLKQVLFGLLAANSNISFASTPSGDITRTLNGVLDLDLKNGKLANVDILQQLASIGKFANLGRSAQNFTNIIQLAGKLNLKNGVASTDNLKAVIEGGSVSASGIANLVDQSLNMHMTAVLTQGLSQQVGGTGIGGFMNTALANKNGELVLPVLVTGTFSSPKFAPDLEKIAQMRLNNLLPTSANPGALTSGILGALGGKGGNAQQGITGILGALGGKQQQQQQQQPKQNNAQQQQQQQNPQNQVNDLLNAFGIGKKKKDQQQQQQPPK